jgi:hypothetical protein
MEANMHAKEMVRGAWCVVRGACTETKQAATPSPVIIQYEPLNCSLILCDSFVSYNEINRNYG